MATDWGAVGVIAAALVGAAGATGAGWVAGKNALKIEDKRQIGQRQVEADRAAEERRRHLAELRRPVYEELVVWTLRFGRWMVMTNPVHGFGTDPGPRPSDDDVVPWRAKLAVVGSPAMAARFAEWNAALVATSHAQRYLSSTTASRSEAEPEPEPWANLEAHRRALREAFDALTEQAARTCRASFRRAGESVQRASSLCIRPRASRGRSVRSSQELSRGGGKRQRDRPEPRSAPA